MNKKMIDSVFDLATPNQTMLAKAIISCFGEQCRRYPNTL